MVEKLRNACLADETLIFITRLEDVAILNTIKKLLKICVQQVIGRYFFASHLPMGFNPLQVSPTVVARQRTKVRWRIARHENASNG